MAEASDLSRYLPISLKNPGEKEYISFLWEAFETNHTEGKYQFAFLAYHMLMMSFVYFNIWQIRQTRPADFEKSLIGFNRDDLLAATSPFTFSTVNERAVLRFLKLIECDETKIGAYRKLVDDRNDVAHPNGNLFLKDELSLERKIAEVLRAVDEVQAHAKPVIEHCYRVFLRQSSDIDAREHADAGDQIREVLVRGNYLSHKDIEFCINTDITDLEHEESDEIRALHGALREAYGTE